MPITYDDPGTLYDTSVFTFDGLSGGPSFVSSVLQIVDPDDSTIVLFDLNDPTGSNSSLYGSVSTNLLQDVDIGIPALKDTGIADVAKPLAFNRQATANMKIHMRFTGSSYDNINKAVGVLSRFLADGCVMKWIPDTSTQTRLIDVLPSPTPILLAGRPANMFEAIVALQTPEGVELNLERLGYMRSDKLVAATNVLANPTLLRDNNNDGLPDSWTQVGTAATPTIQAATESLNLVAGASGRGVYQATGAGTAGSGQSWTLSADIKVASGTVALRIDWRTAADANISNVDQTTSTSVWQRITVTGSGPATTDHIRATVLASGGAATWNIRNVQLEQSGAATPFRVSVQTLQVDPAASGFAQLIPVYNPATSPSPCELLLAFPDSGSKIVEADFALISDKGIDGTRNLSDLLNGPNYAQCEASTNGWTRTLGTATTSVADGNASAGNTAQYAPTTDLNASLPTKIVTETRTTLLDSLRGRFKVYARVKGSGTVAYNLQLHWGPGTVAGEVNDAVTHDCTNVASFHYVYIDVGDIELPREKNITIGQLTLELWAWQSGNADGTPSTKSNFNADHLVFVPTDDSAIATIPGESATSLNGKFLTSPPKKLTADPVWIAGAVKSGSMRLNALNEAAGYGDNTNGAFTGSTNTRHIIRFNIHANQSPGGTMTYVYGVANITDDTSNQISAPYNIPAALSLTQDYVLDDTAAKVYQPRIGITALSSSGAHIDVDTISISSVPYIPQNGKLRSDPGSLPTRAVIEQVDSSGNLGLEADSTGIPFWIPPGLSLIYVNVFDVANLGYNENQSTLARTFTVTPTVYPRFWS